MACENTRFETTISNLDTAIIKFALTMYTVRVYVYTTQQIKTFQTE